MSKLRKLIPLLTIVALALVAVPVLVLAEPAAWPASYLCTVYVGDELAGPGITVEAFVGDETTPRTSGVTDADSLVNLQVPVDTEELGEGGAILFDIKFKVSGVWATEDPNVGLMYGGPMVDLSIPGDVEDYPDISVATSLAFGSVLMGTDKTKTLTISNTGTATLTISSITVSNSQFSIGTYETTIAAGGSDSVDVTFAPTSTGAQPATLTIISNDPDEGSVTVSLSGTGFEPGNSFASWLYTTFVECL